MATPALKLKPHTEGDTLWLPLAAFYSEFNRPRQTLAMWCRTGFILTLGYRAKRDVTGHWFLSAATKTE